MEIPFRLPLSVNSSATPAATSANNTFVFYKGANDDPGIYVTRSLGALDEGQWTNAVRLPQAVNTSAAPSAVTLNGTLYVAYKGADTDSSIYLVRSPDSTLTWYMTQLPATVNTSTGPDAYVFGDTIYVFYKGAGDDQGVYIATLPSNAQWTLIS